ncbi:MAG TPA: tol-pal system protein YbgF [Stellaceae bacterium]|jgi:tol-pal system protein YbgF
MKKLLFLALLGTLLAAGAPAVFAQQDQDQDQDSDYQRPVPRAARDEARFDQLTDQMRELTGRIEELNHQVDTLRARLDKMSGDVDMRLQALEHPGSAPGGPPPPTAMKPPRDEAPVLTPPRRNSGNPPPSQTFNQPPRDQQTAAAAAPPPPDAGALPSGSPQQQYDYAFGLLRDANYPAAERALRDFVHRYPTNRLSSNAQYWLGETYFVRRDYQAAAAAFAEGYQRYPKGPKAADDLLKLGSSLAMLNRKADACRSFAQLDRDFPIVPANLKAKEAEEKRRAGCH